MSTIEQQLQVSAIKSGTVIDHVRAGQALTIVRLLNLAAQHKTVTIGMNLPSRKMGHKDLIKVANYELPPEEANRVAILAPDADINIIANYKIKNKFKVSIPSLIERLIVCPNPHCVSNHEPMGSKFATLHRGETVAVRCWYCEKTFTQDEIVDYRV